MDIVPGFVSVPRLAGSPRPAGAFFSARVEAHLGPGLWQVRLDGRSQVISTVLELSVGQNLRLKLVSDQGARSLLQVLAPPEKGPEVARAELGPLASAFLSRGLPLAAERLSLWSRWLTRANGPSDRETWAASLEARGWDPSSPQASTVEPWLAWQAQLEEGHAPPAPEDETLWDEWNLHPTVQGDSWLVVPLHWEFEGRGDSGLLQAHWNPQAQRIDQWRLTAAPSQVPFRIEAQAKPGRLDLVWRFFRPEDARSLSAWLQDHEHRWEVPDLEVTLVLADTPSTAATPVGKVDVQA